MSKNNLINLYCFDQEIGRLSYDENRSASFFQYNPAFLELGLFTNLFPLIIKRIRQTQVFDKYNNGTFRGLPPMIADSLPDLFGNIIFKAWIESTNRQFEKVSVLEQLAYVGKRGMGALEYLPSKELGATDSIDISEITEVVRQVLNNKTGTNASSLDHASLLNIFKIGTSAGGMRPKILISEHVSTGEIIPGDLVTSADYNHYLIKLDLEQSTYSREMIEYSYYLAATMAGIVMMPSKMIEGRHFATVRFDRQQGKKRHALTATGIAGLDYNDPKVSNYEQLFDLALFLKVPHRDMEQLFRRMVFNLVFANHDDHLKNHAFIYDEEEDSWQLAPAYDLTYSLNPEINFKTRSRALSVNGKRIAITIDDLLIIADNYTIKNPKKIISEVNDVKDSWVGIAKELAIPEHIINTMIKNFWEVPFQ